MDKNTSTECFVRHCPSCNAEIIYASRTAAQCFKQAEANGRVCRACAHDQVREKTRSANHRALKSKQSRALWADQNSTFNTSEYRKKLSTGQANVWVAPEKEVQRERRLESLRKSWRDISHDERETRVQRMQLAAHTPEAERKRGASLKQAYKDNPGLGAAISKRTKLLMLNPDYKRRCTEKFIEAAQRTGGTSKQERDMAEKLLPLGFKHKVKRCGVWVDFFNPETNTIIEYFGDWWHAHPKYHARINAKYGGRHPNKQHRTIAEIIEHDTFRLHTLQRDHSVIVIWESDAKIPERLASILSMLDEHRSNVDEYVSLMMNK